MKYQGRIFEWRINENREEIFRTRSRKELYVTLANMKAENPDTAYSIQTRYVPTNGHGAPLLLPNGEPQWSTWC